MATIAELRTVEQITDLAALLDRVWDNHSGSIVQPALLRALAHSGNYVVGAFVSGGLIGGSVGFLGRDLDGVYLHSHVTAVLPDAQNRGVGRTLKLHQREWCLERGVDEVRWTFDPLVRRNAVLNLNRLGAVVTGYAADFYGVMDDALNAGDPSDRFLVTWELRSERVRDALDAVRPTLSTPELVAARVPWVVREQDGEPLISTESGDRLLSSTPEDVVAMRRFAPDRAMRWRMAIREGLGPLLTAGAYRITAVTSEGDYLLERSG